ncbi:hypothetical protein [Hyalangium minutum]|uniref:hypothetical protein n=1 Tax=Hyalangium minutum TaxID=394096 RepID=UPI0004E7336F|nr:hypothetical protein [Hyalangium minutum]
MLPRALVPTVLFAAVLWPLRALACINSMDASSIFTAHTVWTDLIVWTVGAVFLNQVVIANVRAPAVEGQPAPSRFRKAFFLLVGACLVLVMGVVSAGGPLLNFGEIKMSTCLFDRRFLLLMMGSPAVVFVLHSVLFQRLSRWLFSGDRLVTLVTLVVSSVLLAVGVDMVRESILLPKLCGATSYLLFGHSQY